MVAKKIDPAAQLSARKEALRLASETGYDARTTLKALLGGPEAIRPLAMRERLRPAVEAWRAANGL